MRQEGRASAVWDGREDSSPRGFLLIPACERPSCIGFLSLGLWYLNMTSPGPRYLFLLEHIPMPRNPRAQNGILCKPLFAESGALYAPLGCNSTGSPVGWKP